MYHTILVNLFPLFKIFFFSSAEFVAQFKHTVILMPNGLHILTGHPFDVTAYNSEYSLPEDLKPLVEAELKLAEALAAPKEKKKKPKKGKENKTEGEKPEAAKEA